MAWYMLFKEFKKGMCCDAHPFRDEDLNLGKDFSNQAQGIF